MKASEFLKGPEQAAWSAGLAAMVRTVSRTGALYAIGSGFDCPVTYLPGEDWEPLLTRDQWKAEQAEKAARVVESWGQGAPSGLTLRRLAPGEAMVVGQQYLKRKRHNGECVTFTAEQSQPFFPYDDYYELPDLSVSEPNESTEASGSRPDELGNAGSVQPDSPDECHPRDGSQEAQGKSRPLQEPAPNPVGERLTEAPEAGTWVVSFGKHVPDGCVYRWGGKKEPWREDCRYYRWLGRIPEEPKPKPEPPKWLGAVDDVQIGDTVYVTNIYDKSTLQGVSNLGYPRSAINPARAKLRPDIMPPSPELAALFAGGEVT